jgi:hypothetical protein
LQYNSDTAKAKNILDWINVNNSTAALLADTAIEASSL